jgi:NADH dehydrogenase
MEARKVLLIGGTGFVGSALAAQLAAQGVDLCLPTRHPERVRHLSLLPTADPVRADVHDPATLTALMRGVDAVVNLVGVLHSRPGTPYGPAFARAHVELPAKIARAAVAAGVPRLVHVSALGADPQGPSEYQRSKAAGEDAVRSAGEALQWIILRPSVIFGQHDHFLNLFAGLLRLFPVLPLAGAQTCFQPVWVEDVARVACRCVGEEVRGGQTFELAGPTIYTLRQLVTYVGVVSGHRRPVIGLPEGLAMLQARLMELAPQPLMSRDNLRSMRVDNIASGPALPFGLEPTALEAVAPCYLAPQPAHAARTLRPVKPRRRRYG